MGLIPVAAVIRWADQMIIAAEKPEAWLIDLATTRADNHDVISVLKCHGASADVDDDTLLALLAYGFFHSRLTLSEVNSSLLNRFCFINWATMTPLRQQIYILDDEMGWDMSRAHQTCQSILQPFRDAGERLVKSYTYDT